MALLPEKKEVDVKERDICWTLHQLKEWGNGYINLTYITRPCGSFPFSV